METKELNRCAVSLATAIEIEEPESAYNKVAISLSLSPDNTYTDTTVNLQLKPYRLLKDGSIDFSPDSKNVGILIAKASENPDSQQLVTSILEAIELYVNKVA